MEHRGVEHQWFTLTSPYDLQRNDQARTPYATAETAGHGSDRERTDPENAQ